MDKGSEETGGVVDPKAMTEETEALNVDSTVDGGAPVANDEVNASNGGSAIMEEHAPPDNEGVAEATSETNEVEVQKADDDNAAPASNSGPAVVPTQRPVISEDDIVQLQNIVDLVIEIGKGISQAQNDDDDEEGAIEEDEVPFERVPDVEVNSNIVHILNMPPEMNMEALVTKVGAMPTLIFAR